MNSNTNIDPSSNHPTSSTSKRPAPKKIIPRKMSGICTLCQSPKSPTLLLSQLQFAIPITQTTSATHPHQPTYTYSPGIPTPLLLNSSQQRIMVKDHIADNLVISRLRCTNNQRNIAPALVSPRRASSRVRAGLAPALVLCLCHASSRVRAGLAPALFASCSIGYTSL